MNVLFSSREYDYHTLVKVAETTCLAGMIGFHPDRLTKDSEDYDGRHKAARLRKNWI